MSINYPLDDIERYGSTRLTIEQISIILEVDEKKLQKEFDKKGDLYRAYQKGYLMTEIKIREQIILLAESGSTPAQNLYYEKISKNSYDEL